MVLKDNFFLNALFTPGCENVMGIPRTAFSQPSCFGLHHGEAKFNSATVYWSPTMYQANMNVINQCTVIYLNRRYQRHLVYSEKGVREGFPKVTLE